MQLNLFNGGLSIRLAQHLIEQSCSVECKNVDFEKGTLSPLKGNVDTTQKGERSLYYFNKHWIFADAYRDYVEYQEKLYFSDGQGKPQKSANGVEFYNLGIEPPAKIPDVSFAELDTLPKLGSVKSSTTDVSFALATPSPSSPSFPINISLSILVKIPCKDSLVGDYHVYKKAIIPANSQATPYILQPRKNGRLLDTYISIDGGDYYKYNYRDVIIGFAQVSCLTPLGLTSTKIEEDDRDYENHLLEEKQLNFVLEVDKNLFTLSINTANRHALKAVDKLIFNIIKEVESIRVFFVEESIVKELKVYKTSNTEFYVVNLKTFQTTKTDMFYFTFYNSKDGIESTPINTELLPSLYPITFTVPKTDDPQVDYVKIYAIAANYTKPVFIKQIPLYADTVTISLSDIANSTSEVLNSYNNYPAPTALQFLTESNSMLFGALGYTLYYSSIGQPNYWSPFDFITFDDNITGLGATQNGLLVFTIGKTYIITGTSPDTFTKILLDGGQGCLTHRSVNTINNNLVWLSSDGVVASSGGNIQNLTKDKLGKLDLGSVYCNAVADETYYLSTNKGTLILDFRYSFAIQFSDFIYLGLHRQVMSDTLYGVTPTKNLVILNADDSNYKTLTYKSPKFPSGSISSLKNYKTFYVNSTGNLNFKIYLDDVLVTNINLKGGVEEIRVPQEYMRSYFVQFEVTGVGTLIELEWQVEDRQNGR